MSSPEEQKLPLSSLTAMVIGSMIGAQIFSLPRTFANATGPFGALIAWAIAGTGMYMLARVFQALAEKRPDIDNGVFAYAKAGFGDYVGFLSAFGYWIGSVLGNVFYWVLIGATLGRFFPYIFGDGTSVISIIVSLIGVWAFHFMILRGVKEATFINKIVTVAKIVPLIVAILVFVFFFNYSQFSDNFFGGVGMPEKTHDRAGARYDADHGVRVHRHRRRECLFPLRHEALGRGLRDHSRLRRRHGPHGRGHAACPTATAPRAAIAGVAKPVPRGRARNWSSGIGGRC